MNSALRSVPRVGAPLGLGSGQASGAMLSRRVQRLKSSSRPFGRLRTGRTLSGPGPSSSLLSNLDIASRRILGARSKAFTRLWRASHFSLRAQRKVTKRKSTPMQRSPGILPCDFAQRLRGWLTVHPWTGSQLARIPASHPSGLFSATAPLHRGPIHCASCAAKTERLTARSSFGFGIGFALRFGAQDARYKGPVSGGGRAQERPAGWARGIAPSSLPAHGGAVSEPPEPCRAVAGQEPGDHRFGVAFSLPTFSWPRKRK